MKFNSVDVEFEDDELIEMIADRLQLNILKGVIFSDEFTDWQKVEICKELLKEKETKKNLPT